MKNKILQFLNWLSKYTGTDMVYIATGSFWWILGRIFSFLASFLILIAFAKFATKEVYGAYQYIISMAAMIGILTLPGIDTALITSIAKGKEKTFFLCEKEKLKFGSIVFLISALISLWYFFHKNFELAISFLIVGVFLPLLSIFSLYLAFWQGRKRFDLQNKFFIFHNFLGAGILILFIIFQPKIIFVIFGFYFGFTLATFIFWLKTKKEIKKEGEEEKETIAFGKHLTIMGIPWAISSQIDNVLIWQFVGAKALAIYAFALRLVERISELIPFSALALPKMAEKDFNQVEIKKRIFDKFLKLFFLAIPFGIFYIILCPFIFKIFFPSYKESIIFSQVLALSFFASPFSFLATSFLATMKKRELYFLNFLPHFLKIFFLFLLIPLFKIWGAIFSILIFHLFYSFLTLYFYKKL